MRYFDRIGHAISVALLILLGAALEDQVHSTGSVNPITGIVALIGWAVVSFGPRLK